MLSSSKAKGVSEAEKYRVTNASEAHALVEGALAALDMLEPLIAEETSLLREGLTRQALSLSVRKAEAAGVYTRALEALKGNAIALGRFAPDELALLRRRHDNFSELLTYNMVILTTARSVSEGIMREISAQAEPLTNPSGYGPNGRSPKSEYTRPTGAPIAVSKAV